MVMPDAAFAEAEASQACEAARDRLRSEHEVHAAPGYMWDSREFEFILWELFRIQEGLGQAPCEKIGRSEIEALCQRAVLHIRKLAAVNAVGDKDPARLLDDGSVYIPEAFLP